MGISWPADAKLAASPQDAVQLRDAPCPGGADAALGPPDELGDRVIVERGIGGQQPEQLAAVRRDLLERGAQAGEPLVTDEGLVDVGDGLILEVEVEVGGDHSLG